MCTVEAQGSTSMSSTLVKRPWARISVVTCVQYEHQPAAWTDAEKGDLLMVLWN